MKTSVKTNVARWKLIAAVGVLAKKNKEIPQEAESIVKSLKEGYTVSNEAIIEAYHLCFPDRKVFANKVLNRLGILRGEILSLSVDIGKDGFTLPDYYPQLKIVMDHAIEAYPVSTRELLMAEIVYRNIIRKMMPAQLHCLRKAIFSTTAIPYGTMSNNTWNLVRLGRSLVANFNNLSPKAIDCYDIYKHIDNYLTYQDRLLDELVSRKELDLDMINGVLKILNYIPKDLTNIIVTNEDMVSILYNFESEKPHTKMKYVNAEKK